MEPSLILLLKFPQMCHSIDSKQEGKKDKKENIEELLTLINNRDPNQIHNKSLVQSLFYFYQNGGKIDLSKENLTRKALYIKMKSDRKNMRTILELLSTSNFGIFFLNYL